VADASSDRRIALVSLGCRVSRADLDAVAAAVDGRLAVARPGEGASCVVVATCTLTADADAAARQAIRRAAREHPGAPIVAMGCYAARDPAALAALPGVTAVVGARGEGTLGEVLSALGLRAASGAASGRLARHTRPFLKVQDGCDARCAYCVVPLARGPSRSVPLAEAVARVEALAAAHREVVLTGVHLGAYGRDLSPRASLSELVQAAAARGPRTRLRLSSVEPLELPLELLSDPAAAPALCPHLHLPLQSGSDRILAAMRRPYGAARYGEIVREAVRRLPGACIGADVLTGFPGETDADHRATLSLVEALPLAYLHVFPFSPRPGTEAAGMGDAVPAGVARARAGELRAVSERRWRAFVDGLVGRDVEVVVERVEDGIARGTAREYATVRWRSRGAARGAIARVRVAGREDDVAVGVEV